MSLALHFFKRDVRRASWLYSLWFLLFVIEGILALTAHSPSPPNFVASLRSVFLFSVLHVVVLAVLVPQFIQEDAQVGSAAFWMTRPISRGTLLLAKMLVLGLIVLIPLVVNAVALVVFGVSPGELGLAAAEILMNQLLFVVPIAVLASLTPNFARYAAVTVAVVVGMGGLMAVLPTVVRAGPAGGSFAAAALADTQTLVASVLLIVGGGMILVHQYLTRRSRRSIAMATCLAGAFVLVGKFWSWNLVRDEPLGSSSLFEPAKVALQISAGSLNNAPYNSLFSDPVGKNIDGGFSVSGLPPELFVQVRSANPRLSAFDGTKIKTLGAISTVPFSQFDPLAVSAIAAAIGGIPAYSFYLGGSSTTFVTVDGATFLRYKDSPVKLVDDLDIVVSRYELTAELPIVSGSRYDRGSTQVRINGLVPRIDGITIVVAESSVNLRFSHRFQVFGQPTDPRLRGNPIYLLVNRQRREAALVNPAITRNSAYQIHLGGLIVEQSIELPFGGAGDRRSPTIDSQWLAGATLVRLERVPVAEFSKTAEVALPKLGEPWLSLKARDSEATSRRVGTAIEDQSNAGAVIRVSRDGVVTLDGKAETDEQLAALLVRTHKTDPNATVIIVSDEGTELKRMTQVMDACRTAGINKLRLRAR